MTRGRKVATKTKAAEDGAARRAPPAAPRSGRAGSAEAKRRALIDHVRAVQRDLRSCEGCGLCCTAQYNTVRILPVEAGRIAAHLRRLPAERRGDLMERLAAAVRRDSLNGARKPRRYTCPFLEVDRRCALPFTVKPVACLAFNPISLERCEMDAARFFAAHDPLEASSGRFAIRQAIPVAVLSALAASR